MGGKKKKRGKTVADLPELVAQWHPEKNGDRQPKDVSWQNRKPVWWRCPKVTDFEWSATVTTNLRDGGCPACREHAFGSLGAGHGPH